MSKFGRTSAVIAASALLLVGCGHQASSAPSAASATKAALEAAVRDYHACGLDVLTPTAQGDCLDQLLLRLNRYAYKGQAVTLYKDARSAGAQFKQCLDRVAVSDVSNCDGSHFYESLSQLIGQFAPSPTP